ncbi:jg4558 [Pararge aegeria aegeria]|uniref:Jg4558 protein n=1 Tax=Pararge aegeria aegeria TaxID=348720 RepID=A0A8S4RNF8_9NEOP|nr:jg4558 [Pararge aegeria aegeria]
MQRTDGYHAQCYKLFTAIKIPPDFLNQQENESISDSAQEISGEDSELLVPVSSTTTQVADEKEAGESNLEQYFEDPDDGHYHADEPLGKENLPPLEYFICYRNKHMTS